MQLSKSLKIEFTKDIPIGLDLLLNGTIYGQEGKLQYRHRNPINKLQQIKHKLIFALRRNDKIINTAVYVERQTQCKDQKFKSFYIRYLSFNANFKSKKRKALSMQKKQVKDGSLRSIVKSYSNNFFNSYIEESDKKAVFYAYIEGANINSYGFAELFDCITIRKIRNLLFSRFKPKVNPDVTLILEEEKDIMLQNLNSAYYNHTFFTTDDIFSKNNYYILKNNDTIVAGVKASLVSWDIIKIPGIEGFLMQKVFPYIPYLINLFKAKRIDFIAFEGAWYKNGCEGQMINLMESICATFNFNIGMLWFDKECEIGKGIYETKKLGLLNKLKGNINSDIIFTSLNLTEQDKNLFKNNPAYISAYDLT